MAVRETRQRYISFVIENGCTDRRGMIREIREVFSGDHYERCEPWLTVFSGKGGILRCNHTCKELAIELLNSIRVGQGRVKTVYTSGTIKKAKERLSEYES